MARIEQPARPHVCARVSDQLGEFIGNELNGAAAREVAAHLETCVACRHEYDGLRAVREGLRRLAATTPTPAAKIDAARGRAFAHLERSLTAAEKPEAPPARTRGTWHWPTLLVWRSVATTLVAATVGAGAVFLMPLQTVTPDAASSPDSPAAVGVKTPSKAELTALFDLHDAHAVAWSGDEAVLHRDEAAEAHNALLTRADTLAAEGL